MRTNSSTTVRVLVGTATAALALLVSAGCGAGAKNNAASTGTAPAAPASGAAAAASSAPSAATGMDAGSPSAGGMGGGAAAKTTIEETKTGGMDHYAFKPASVNVTNDQITIVNKSDENQKLSCTGAATTGLTVNAGKTGTLKFTKDGKYSCSTNHGAKLTLEVV